MIPNIFYQAWDDYIPYKIHSVNKAFFKKYDYKLFNILDMQNYLRTKWGEKMLYLFNKYQKICHKVDLWRYCILYDTGGVYMDADCILINKFDFLNRHSVFVTNDRGEKNIFNGFMMTSPKNPIFKKIIEFMVKVDTSLEHDYYFNCKELYNIVCFFLKTDKLNKHNYGNVTILIDKHVKGGFYPFYNNIPILLEENDNYPYIQKKGFYHVWIGNSTDNVKTIEIPQLPNAAPLFLNEHQYDDTFEITQTETSIIIRRTDKNEGWGHPHSGYIKWEEYF